MKRLLIVLILSSICLKTQADSYPRPGNEDKFGFYLTGNRSQTRIPFEFKSNLIIIAVRINDKDTARFIVDTGVGHTIITDPRVLTSGSLKVVRQVTLGGAGGGSHQMASVAVDNSLAIGNLRIEHHSLIILDKDVLTLSEYAGTPIHGIIGYELFANVVVTVDFERREISLVQCQKYRYHRRKGDQYPITIRDRKAYTDALSVFDGNRFQPLRVVLDTGAGDELLFVNRNEAATLNIGDIYRMLQAGEGRKINVVARRNGQLFSAQFTLKRLI